MTVRLAVFVYFGLMGLLVLTVVSSAIPLGPGNTVLNLVIAAAKAGLIGLFYMHLRRSGMLISLVVAALGFWLLILFGMTLVDFVSR